MGRRCCIITCKNATIDDCDERVSFFRVPTDGILFDQWLRAIESTGSELSKTSAVCERHFREDEIRRMAVHRDSFGNVIFQRPLTKCSLTKNAVPTIFDDNPELAKKRKKRRVIKRPDELKTTETGVSENNANDELSMNYGNILLTFPSQNNVMQLNLSPNNVQSEVQKNHSLVPDYVFNGLETLYHDDYSNVNLDHEKGLDHSDANESIVSIVIRPQEDSNNIENISSNKASEQPEASKELPKEITIIVPESELALLNGTHQEKPKRKRTRKDVEPNEGTIHYPLPESDIQRNIRTFDLIFYNSDQIKLPSPMWGYHKNGDNKNVIIFSKARWFEDVLMPPNYEKQVVFHESDNIKIYINSKFSPLEVRRPSDMHEMELILRYVDEVVVCQGGPNVNEFVVVPCAQKDHAVSRWRHKLCPIIVSSDGNVCKFCTTINKVHRYPKKKRLPFGRRRPADEESC